LIALFGVQGNTQNKQIFLNFFRIFPEELYNRKLKIGENRRQEIELEMAAETVQVLNILVNFLFKFYYKILISSPSCVHHMMPLLLLLSLLQIA